MPAKHNCDHTGTFSPWEVNGSWYSYDADGADCTVSNQRPASGGYAGDYACETGLFENWNRYYDPSTGRYLQPEPLLRSPIYPLGEATQGRAVPTYAYAFNNPIKYIDSTGLQGMDTATAKCAQNPEMCAAMGMAAAAGAAAATQAAQATAATQQECDKTTGPQMPFPRFEICVNTGLGNPFRPEVACEYQCPSGRKVYAPEVFGVCLPITISQRPVGN